MKSVFLIQMALVWLITAVVLIDVMKRNSTISIVAELFSLAAAIALLLKFWVLKKDNIVSNDKVFMINARDLSIAWSDNPEYWSWLPLPNKKPNQAVVEAAVLDDVCWLDVSGKFDTKNLRLGTKYEVIFVVKLDVNAYGWDWAVKLKLVMPSNSETPPQEYSVCFVEHIGKQWIDIPAGEFLMTTENVGVISFSLYEHDSNMWKSGLVVKGVVIRPKHHV